MKNNDAYGIIVVALTPAIMLFDSLLKILDNIKKENNGRAFTLNTLFFIAQIILLFFYIGQFATYNDYPKTSFNDFLFSIGLPLIVCTGLSIFFLTFNLFVSGFSLSNIISFAVALFIFIVGINFQNSEEASLGFFIISYIIANIISIILIASFFSTDY